MTLLAVVGAGDLGQLIAHHALTTDRFTFAGFYDDTQVPGATVGVGPVLGRTADVRADFRAGRFDTVLVAVGYKHFTFRQRLFEDLSGVVPLARLVHPGAWVDPSCAIGAGVVVSAGCTLDRNVRLLENVFLNVGVTVAHDSVVGAHSFVGPGVSVAGFSQIGRRCFLGVGAVVSSRVRVCDDCRLGAGAVVTRDLASPGTYAGVPARPIAKDGETG